MAGEGAPAISPPDSPRDRRCEQRRRWRFQIRDIQECLRQRAVARRGEMKLADVPVDEPPHGRARTRDSGMPQIVPDRDVPGNVDDLRGGLEESPRKMV